MEGKGGAAATAGLVGFLGMGFDRVRLLPLPEKLSAKALRSNVRNTCHGSRQARERRWRWMAMLWVVGWTLICLQVFRYSNSGAVEKRRDSLASMCDERARMLQDQFNVSMNHLQVLAILVNTFHHSQIPSAITQATFARYAERTAFERPLTSGVAYAVRVMHVERDQFERQQGWSIKKMYSSPSSQGPGDAAVAEIRGTADEYAPVIFAQDAYKNVISFDMLSGAVRDHLLPPSLLCSSLAYNSFYGCVESYMTATKAVVPGVWTMVYVGRMLRFYDVETLAGVAWSLVPLAAANATLQANGTTRMLAAASAALQADSTVRAVAQCPSWNITVAECALCLYNSVQDFVTPVSSFASS
ncbi:putative histidine kinase [Hordeum vulgare]|nr:putative histidine kinase [Hordeum vulgare]